MSAKTIGLSVAALAIALVSGAAGWFFWTRSDGYQVRAVVAAVEEAFRAEPAAKHDLVTALALTNRGTEALEAALAEPRIDGRITYLASIAEAMAQAGKTDDNVFAQSLLEAMTLLKKIDDPRERFGPVGNVSAALIAAGKAENAVALHQQLTLKAFEPGMQAMVIARLAKVRALTDAAEAKKYAEWASMLAAETPLGEFGASLPLSMAAWELAEGGMKDESQKIARLLPEDQPRASTLSSIAARLAKAGKKAEAQAASRDAIAEARTLAAGSRNGVLEDAVAALAEAGEGAEAIRVVETEGSASPVLLAAVANGMAQAGNMEQARQVITRALSAAPGGSGHDTTYVKTTAAVVLAELGDSAAAFSTLSEVTEDTSRAYATLARAFARQHRYREARLAAARCTSPLDQLPAYVSILREYAMEHRRATPST